MIKVMNGEGYKWSILSNPSKRGSEERGPKAILNEAILKIEHELKIKTLVLKGQKNR
jgi:hypothetical protein